jgi:alkaline phosphatase
MGRLIEERIEFDDAVAAVSAYLDANTSGNNWANTLVIVTADHDHLLLGPDSDTIPYQDLVNNGTGHVRGHKWQNDSHSNQLVPRCGREYDRGVRQAERCLCGLAGTQVRAWHLSRRDGDFRNHVRREL